MDAELDPEDERSTIKRGTGHKSDNQHFGNQAQTTTSISKTSFTTSSPPGAKKAPADEVYDPPISQISTLKYPGALLDGQEKEKWIVVNIQDREMFACQILNRELWHHDDIMSAISEHFIFLQWYKDDKRAGNYIRRYMEKGTKRKGKGEDENKKSEEEVYPHIAVVDPRNGKQVKVWSGHVPKPLEFLADLYELEFMWDS